MKNLLLTLGHNSSAVLIEDNQLKWGYETERVTGVKSDSHFPLAVIQYAIPSKPDMVYVTHWAPTGILSNMSSKHWNPSMFDGIPIRTLSSEFTHHDAHMAGALCYAGPKFPRTKTIGLVIDGFGIFGEHFSVYDLAGAKPRLLERVHGYDTSLGLWYQYATAFLGMKMHEDEYKLLGYEAHIDSFMAEKIDVIAHHVADEWIFNMTQSPYGSVFDPVYNLDALAAVKDRIYSHLNTFAKQFGITDVFTFDGRVCISYYVQKVLELVVLKKLTKYPHENILLSGGVFYNVKLNKRIIDSVGKGQVCVYPLSGDQGCAIGLYAHDHPEWVFPEDLNWGHRDLIDVGYLHNLIYADNEEHAEDLVDRMLKTVGYVNLVRGSMEFGPRALCNTSTLAKPTPANVQKINMANNRNTVMPMAPVVNMSMYKRLFEKWDQVWKSYQHMIVALEYYEHPEEHQMGIAHKYTYPHIYHTGRPQVVDKSDVLMNNLLLNHGPLINTSFNFHGLPIALGMDSVVENHTKQLKNDPLTTTVVLKNG